MPTDHPLRILFGEWEHRITARVNAIQQAVIIFSNNLYINVQSYTDVNAGDFHAYQGIFLEADYNGNPGFFTRGISAYSVDNVNQMVDAVGTQFKRMSMQ